MFAVEEFKKSIDDYNEVLTLISNDTIQIKGNMNLDLISYDGFEHYVVSLIDRTLAGGQLDDVLCLKIKDVIIHAINSKIDMLKEYVEKLEEQNHV